MIIFPLCGAAVKDERSVGDVEMLKGSRAMAYSMLEMSKKVVV